VKNGWISVVGEITMDSVWSIVNHWSIFKTSARPMDYFTDSLMSLMDILTVVKLFVQISDNRVYEFVGRVVLKHVRTYWPEIDGLNNRITDLDKGVRVWVSVCVTVFAEVLEIQYCISQSPPTEANEMPDRISI
jgi:GMP synthase PP-ATPase subunit